MSTESARIVTDPASQPEAAHVAASLAKQGAAHANVDVRYLGAEDMVTRRLCALPSGSPSRALSGIARFTATESYPYSSFEQGGVRRFERSPFARGLFERGGDLPPFRVS